MTLPILLSVPHAGLRVPPEAESYCSLSEEEIIADGDEGAAEIFDLADHVAEFVTTDVARAIVDLNRATDDRRPDGVVKTHTCWNVPVYRNPLPDEVIAQLLNQYYHPYHERLADGQTHPSVRLCVDCHTMAAIGPPIGPGAGEERPFVCLGDGNGTTLPPKWIDQLARCFGDTFETEIAVNKPFSGGYITTTYGRNRPWVQVELSRAAFLTLDEKRTRILSALSAICDALSLS